MPVIISLMKTTTNDKTEAATTEINCNAYQAIEWAVTVAAGGSSSVSRVGAWGYIAAAQATVRDYQTEQSARFNYRAVRRLGHVHTELVRAAREIAGLLYADGYTMAQAKAQAIAAGVTGL